MYDIGQKELLDKHLELVLAANEKVNLTRIDSWEQGQLLHIEDSLSIVKTVEKAPAGVFADLGSGAGFPGIPLSIASGRQGVLVESVGKKADFLAAAVRKLRLADDVEVYSGRAEELAQERPGAFSVVVARALSVIPSLMELASPLLIDGGWLVCMKAQGVDEENEAALPIQEKLAMYFKTREDFLLSDGVTKRSIVVFKKQGTAQVPLPRRTGMAQKKPYKS